MTRFQLLPTLLLTGLTLAACDMGGGHDRDRSDKKEERVHAVKVAPPSRGQVEDFVHTTATLESDRRAEIHARIDGIVVKKVRDLGDLVGGAQGPDSLLLGHIDDEDYVLALREAAITLEDKHRQIEELVLARTQAEQDRDRTKISVRETEMILKRAETGVQDGTFTLEERDRARFAHELAEKQMLTNKALIDKAGVKIELGKIAVQQAEVARDRAKVRLSKAAVQAPFHGVVTFCDLREGERVRVGDHLYTIEDPKSLVVYARIPVRDAARVQAGSDVHVTSTAAAEKTAGKVLIVAPTVDRDSGTVTVKIAVTPAAGFKPGLYVALKIVVAIRTDALIVPKKAVLTDEEEGPYLFIVEEDRAKRVSVKTGYERTEVIEVDGIEETAQVVVEGQDTLTDGAKIAIQS
ncbi:MAG: efflux RND transporter periplasmic adaptor subunit [Planctomycetota bacterium]